MSAITIFRQLHFSRCWGENESALPHLPDGQTISVRTSYVPEALAKCLASLANLRSRTTLTEKFAIHFPGIEGLDKPIVWVFPKLLVCLNCGFTEFAIPETEVRRIVEADAA